MLSCLFSTQQEIRDVQREERQKRANVRMNADAEIARIHAETEAAKKRIDETANHNMTIIHQFSESIQSCNSAEELTKLWDNMASQLKSY